MNGFSWPVQAYLGEESKGITSDIAHLLDWNNYLNLFAQE